MFNQFKKGVIQPLDDPTAIVVPEWFSFLEPEVRARITDAEVRPENSLDDWTIATMAKLLDFYAP